MVGDDIITALKNAIDRGDTLENAIAMAINSGYNQKDVEEASRFVGSVPSYNFQPKPFEELTMPAQKNILGSPKKIDIPFIKQGEPPPIVPPAQKTPVIIPTSRPIQPRSIQQTSPQIQQIRPMQQSQPVMQSQPQAPIVQKQESRQLQPISKEISRIKTGKSYTKEIILLIALLFLLGVLITTFVFKEKILTFLSNI